MSDFWTALSLPWKVCLEQAWTAYCAGSLPIGAAVVDQHGAVLARGRNRRHDPKGNALIGASRLAHAELDALLALPEDGAIRHEWALYTTTEPCPLCMGALSMSGVRRLYYASRDPWAGSVDLLGASPYMSRKPVEVFGPPREALGSLEAIIVAINVDAMLRGRILNLSEVLERKRAVLPAPVRFAEALFAGETLARLRANSAPAPEAYNQLAALWEQNSHA